MCRPDYYQINYKINPWMDTANKADPRKALDQWNGLCDALTNNGARLIFIDPQPDLPDMVFTANGGLTIGNLAIIPNFYHVERKGEESHFAKFFKDHLYDIFKPERHFEGAGDALFLGETLICGYGFRSEMAAYSFVRNKKVYFISLVDPRFYHLDTCFCPLNKEEYLIYPGAFVQEEYDLFRQEFKDAIVVPEKEALRFACNSVCLGKTVVMPSGCPETTKKLEYAGYKVVPVDLSEYIKAGGSARCLCLEIK